MTGWVLRAWRRLRRRLFGQPKLKTAFVEELSDELDGDILYVIGENGHWWFAAVRCPCGCDAILHMNLLPDARPRWKLTLHYDKTATLHPSVWRTKDCRSHFFIRKGRIEWCISLNLVLQNEACRASFGAS